MDPLVLIAAETAEESSKAAFYVAGGLLAVWAVAVSAVGITRPSFPDTGSPARAVIAITVVLVLATMAAAAVTG